MNKKAIIALLVVGILTISVVSAGCTGGNGDNGQPEDQQNQTENQTNETETIYIGSLNSLTGSYATQGKGCTDGAEYAVEQVNQKNGLITETEGIVGPDGTRYKIEMIKKDDKSTPSTGVSKAEELAQQDRIVGMVGAYSSAVYAPVSEVTERYELPYVAMGVDPEPFKQDKEYLFRVFGWATMYGESTADFMKTLDPKPEKIGLMYVDTSSGVWQGEMTKKGLEKQGMDVVVESKFQSGTTTFKPVLSKMQDNNVDALVWIAYAEGGQLLMKQINSMDINPNMVIGFWGTEEPEYISQLGDLSNQSFGMIEFSEKLPFEGANKLVTGYEESTGDEFGGAQMWGYGSTSALLHAIKNVVKDGEEVTRDNVQQALYELDANLATGPVDFASNSEEAPEGMIGQNEHASLFAFQILNGERYFIWPENVKSREPIYPVEWENIGD